MSVSNNEDRIQGQNSVSFIWRTNDKNQSKIHESLIVDKIIDPNEIDKDHENFTLKPQAIVNLILKRQYGNNENISLEKNQIGLLFPKIGRYREGLWVIEPAFVHPNYEGKISVHVCNLSKIPILISKGNKILELVTIQINTANGEDFGHKKNDCTSGEYEKSRRAEALKFPNNFLDIEENTKRITKDIGIESFRSMLMVVIAFFGLIVGASGWLNWNVANKIYTSIIDAKNLEDIDIRKEIKEQIYLELLRQTGKDPKSEKRKTEIEKEKNNRN